MVVALAGSVITAVAALFLGSEGHYPGLFYIQRQALWNNGSYGRHFTILMTWFTLLDLVIVPLVFVAGFVALIRRLAGPVTPAPPGWDVHQTGRRLMRAAVALLLLAIWAVVTGIIAFVPEWFSPLGGTAAAVLLIILPMVPLLGPGLLFDAVIPPSYVEGPIESLQLIESKNRTTVHLYVAGRSYNASQKMTDGLGLGYGSHVGLIASGFSKTVRRLARLQ